MYDESIHYIPDGACVEYMWRIEQSKQTSWWQWSWSLQQWLVCVVYIVTCCCLDNLNREMYCERWIAHTSNHTLTPSHPPTHTKLPSDQCDWCMRVWCQTPCVWKRKCFWEGYVICVSAGPVCGLCCAECNQVYMWGSSSVQNYRVVEIFFPFLILKKARDRIKWVKECTERWVGS